MSTHPGIEPFIRHHRRYEEWFEHHRAAYLSELLAVRALRQDGTLVIGLIDRESPLGRDYVSHQAESVFYRAARFFSAAEVWRLLAQTGFRDPTWLQTLSSPIAGMSEIEPLAEGTGRGASSSCAPGVAEARCTAQAARGWRCRRSSSSSTCSVVFSTASGLRLIESMPISTRNCAISG